MQLETLGERCELPQWGWGRSSVERILCSQSQRPGRPCIWCHYPYDSSRNKFIISTFLLNDTTTTIAVET